MLSNIWIWDLRSGIRKKPIPDPDPGVKKAPDPGSGSATLPLSMNTDRQNCWQNYAYLTEHVQEYKGEQTVVYTICNNEKYIGKSLSGYGF
jgi:hypothetical protein